VRAAEEVGALERPARHRRRRHRSAAREMDRRGHRRRGALLVQAVDQTLRILKPALSEAKRRQRRSRVGMQRLLRARGLTHRRRQLPLGFPPFPRRDQDRSVVHPAVEVEEWAAVPLREPIGRADPLHRALEVCAARARADHAAAREHDGVERAALASQRSGHRLVEQRDPFVDPPLRDETRSQLGERAQLEIHVTGVAGELQRVPGERFDGGRVAGLVGVEEHDPAPELIEGALFDQTSCAPQPAGRGCVVPEVGPVMDAQPEGEARRLDRVWSAAERRIRTLPVVDRGLGLPQPPQCFAQPTECLRRLLAIDRGAKRVARRGPVPCLQGFVPDREQIFARLVHSAMV
jgi:hypothetical protein